MAQAVQELFPGTQVTIGPAIEDGFYYDFARDEAFTPADLNKIEQKMHEIVKRDLPIQREVMDREEAIMLRSLATNKQFPTKVRNESIEC